VARTAISGLSIFPAEKLALLLFQSAAVQASDAHSSEASKKPLNVGKKRMMELRVRSLPLYQKAARVLVLCSHICSGKIINQRGAVFAFG
jgi:hypothetical protein